MTALTPRNIVTTSYNDESWLERNLTYCDLVRQEYPSTKEIRSCTPFDSKTIMLILNFADHTFENDLYSAVPGLVDPAIRLSAIGKLRKIGFGGSANVKSLEIEDKLFKEQRIAVKCPRGTGKSVEENLASYLNNLKVAQKIGNSNYFMKVYGIVVKTFTNKQNKRIVKPYLLMEYVSGQTLDAIFAKKFSFSFAQILLNDLTKGLMHLYDHRVLPIDTKADNLMMTTEYHLKMIDYDYWGDEELDLKGLAKTLFGSLSRQASELWERGHKPGSKRPATLERMFSITGDREQLQVSLTALAKETLAALA